MWDWPFAALAQTPFLAKSDDLALWCGMSVRPAGRMNSSLVFPQACQTESCHKLLTNARDTLIGEGCRIVTPPCPQYTGGVQWQCDFLHQWIFWRQFDLLSKFFDLLYCLVDLRGSPPNTHQTWWWYKLSDCDLDLPNSSSFQNDGAYGVPYVRRLSYGHFGEPGIANFLMMIGPHNVEKFHEFEEVCSCKKK